MKYSLRNGCVLKLLGRPCLYDIRTDELYKLDDAAFEFLLQCSRGEADVREGEKEFIEYCINEGILAISERPELLTAPLRQSPTPSLRYLELLITNRCNLRCSHCYLGDAKAIDLPLHTIKQVLKEFEAMQGLRVLISGGEAILHPGFWEINEMLPGLALRSVLLTNGTLLTRESLKRLRVNEIQISIDGMEHAHDSLRGKGSFKKAMSALIDALAMGIEVSVATIIHSRNLDDFDAMDEMFRRLGIKDWSVDALCMQGNLRENTEFNPPPDIAGRYLSYGFGSSLHSDPDELDGDNPVLYACGAHLMAVLADGRLAKCGYFGDMPLGTAEDGLEVCWKRLRPIKLDELECDCIHKADCRGGCRFRAYIDGDPLGRDSIKCYAYDIIKP